jgi:broad specificity phosphatase PhoE
MTKVDLEDFLYLRHGQSEANLRGLMCGRHCDSRLTEVGREQARLAAEVLGRTSLVLRVKAALNLCAEVTQPALIVSHGGVWMAVQQILELEPARSENAIPYNLQRKANHWT